MNARIPTTIVFAFILFASTAFAQKTEGPKLVKFQMAIMKKGPKWDSTDQQQKNLILHQHLRNIVSLLQSGKVIIAGPFEDNTELVGIFIFRAASTEEAKTWADADPAVKAGLFTPEMHPWLSEDIFKKADMPLRLATVYLAFLKKGPNRKDGDDKDPAIQELQKEHIANINVMADVKKLVAAGPFGDEGDLRGIFVFRVDSLKEAQDLCATDPMVKVDRLRVELHPWQVPVGVLP